MSKWKLSHISAGLTAVTVGYSSSVVIIIDVARKAGASDDMVISWLFALGPVSYTHLTLPTNREV